MLDPIMRRFKDRLLQWPARWLAPRIHPDAISALAAMVGVLAAVLAGVQLEGAALICWLLNRTLDGLDGCVARVAGKNSDFGGYLDILLDFVVYAAVPIGIAVGIGTVAAYLSALILMATFYVNSASWIYLAAILERRGVGAAAQGESTTITMPEGLIGGTETVLFYSFFLLVPTLAQPGFIVMSVLVMTTVVQRLVWSRRELSVDRRSKLSQERWERE